MAILLLTVKVFKISVIIIKNNDVYSDNYRTRLTQKFKSDVFCVIYNRERVNAVDELVDFFEKKNFFNDKMLLVANSAPMLYYI